MITIGDKARDVLMIIAAFCWFFVIYASWVGGANKDNQLIYWGLLACAIMTVVYLMMGAVINEKLPISVLVWPILLNGIVQAIAFTMAYTTKGVKADFIMGMHPGFFGAMVFFWLGNFATTTLSYIILFSSKVAPDDEWEGFMKEVAKQEKLH